MMLGNIENHESVLIKEPHEIYFNFARGFQLFELFQMCFKHTWDIQDREKASWEEDEDEEENEEFDSGFVNFLLQIDGLQEVEEHDRGLLCHQQRSP